ncbi:MAG: hypothetical protein NWE94_06865 [Candidatus Bathyarchaeota archaeon]|nr:hypothetical protein [Candidatus Bathyarchaeota archaeon]
METTHKQPNDTIEQEINRWMGFHRALRREDREAFEQLMETYRRNAYAAEAARSPFPFEPMVITILTAQQKIIIQLERELQTLKQQESAWSSAP